MAKSPNWSVAEVADLKAIAADTTLTWAEVATAVAARDPSRPRRTTSAVRVCASKLGLPVRTDDAGVPLQPGARPKADQAAASDLHRAIGEALSLARAEGRAEVLAALRAFLKPFGGAS